MSNDNKNQKKQSWMPELPTPAFSQTRDAAAACFYAQNYLKEQDQRQLSALLKECFELCEHQTVESLLTHQPPYAQLSETLVEDILSLTHTEGYEILPWREAVLRVLVLDLFSNLKSAPTPLTEDAIARVSTFLDPALRGSTKNACQLLSGLRTRMRKMIRALSVSMLYSREYRHVVDSERMSEDLCQILTQMPEDAYFSHDGDFPFDEFLDRTNTINLRGKFVIRQAVALVSALLPNLPKLDEIIQKACPNWRLNRLNRIDLCILRLAAYEIVIEKQAAPRSVINEAVEFAKNFSTEHSQKFVNGVLQQICSDQRIETKA